MDVLESLQGALHYGKERGDIYLRLWLEPKDRSSCSDSPCSVVDKDDMNPDCTVKNVVEISTTLSTTSRPSAIRGILRSSDLQRKGRDSECEVEQDIEEVSYDSVDAILDIQDSCGADSDKDSPLSVVTSSPKESGSLSAQKKDQLVSFVSFADQTKTPGTSEKRSLTETRFVEQYMTSDMVYHPSFLSAVVLYVSHFYSPRACHYASVTLVVVLFTVFLVLYLLYW